MQDDKDPQTLTEPVRNDQSAGVQPPTRMGGQKVIQPTPGLAEELQAQQQQPVQPVVIADSAQPPKTPQPQQIYSAPSTENDGQMQVGMSASQAGLSHSQSKSSFAVKKLLLKFLIGLILVGGVLAALLFTNVISYSKFKTINYENGKGSSYTLKFYSRYSLKTVVSSVPASSGSSISPNLRQLTSKVSVNGKLPLTMWITTAENVTESTNRGSFASNDCSRNGMPKAFDARVDYIDADISVCAIKQQGLELIYIATFHNQSNGYLVYFAQNVEFSKLLSNPQDAREGLAKVGLQDYQDDIKTILASVKPN